MSFRGDADSCLRVAGIASLCMLARILEHGYMDQLNTVRTSVGKDALSRNVI